MAPGTVPASSPCTALAAAVAVPWSSTGLTTIWWPSIPPALLMTLAAALSDCTPACPKGCSAPVRPSTASIVYGVLEATVVLVLEVGLDEHAATIAPATTMATVPLIMSVLVTTADPPLGPTSRSRRTSAPTVSVTAALSSYDLCIPNATTSGPSPEPTGDTAHPDDPAAVCSTSTSTTGPSGWRASVALARPVAEDAAARVAIMDRFGIRHACIQPSSGYEHPEGARHLAVLNDAVAALRHEAPDRFLGALGTVDLGLGAAALATETKRALDDLGLDGLAWHHRLQGVYIDDPRMRPVLDLLAERRKVAAIHLFADSTFESPWRMENLAEEYRHVQFVAMDGFSSYDRACWMGRIAAHHPNIVFDTAAMTTTPMSSPTSSPRPTRVRGSSWARISTAHNRPTIFPPPWPSSGLRRSSTPMPRP